MPDHYSNIDQCLIMRYLKILHQTWPPLCLPSVYLTSLHVIKFPRLSFSFLHTASDKNWRLWRPLNNAMHNTNSEVKSGWRTGNKDRSWNVHKCVLYRTCWEKWFLQTSAKIFFWSLTCKSNVHKHKWEFDVLHLQASRKVHACTCGARCSIAGVCRCKPVPGVHYRMNMKDVPFVVGTVSHLNT